MSSIICSSSLDVYSPLQIITKFILFRSVSIPYSLIDIGAVGVSSVPHRLTSLRVIRESASDDQPLDKLYYAYRSDSSVVKQSLSGHLPVGRDIKQGLLSGISTPLPRSAITKSRISGVFGSTRTLIFCDGGPPQ